MVALLPYVELIWADETTGTGMTVLSLPIGTTVAVAYAAIDTLLSAMAPLSGAQIVRTRLRYKFRPDTPNVAALGSAVKHTGAFILDTEADEPGDILIVPGILDSLILTSEPLAGSGIDTTNADILSFINSILAGGASNVFGSTLTTLVAAYVQSRT